MQTLTSVKCFLVLKLQMLAVQCINGFWHLWYRRYSILPTFSDHNMNRLSQGYTIGLAWRCRNTFLVLFHSCSYCYEYKVLMMAGMYLMGFVPSMLANINVFLQLVHVIFFCFCYSFITLLNVSIVFLICFLRVSERVFS